MYIFEICSFFYVPYLGLTCLFATQTRKLGRIRNPAYPCGYCDLLKKCIFILREIETAQAGEEQRERERENPKPAPHCQH